nr:proline-rich protein 36-like [Aegilops tauschii subsp. strangulata]
MSDEELDKVLHLLVAEDHGYPPDTHLPLYHRPDGAKIAAAMPVFNKCGLVPPAPTGAPAAAAPVMVSFGESGEEERPDSEATWEGSGETPPFCAVDLLRTFRDDDEACEHPVRESPNPVEVTTRSEGTPPKKPPARFLVVSLRIDRPPSVVKKKKGTTTTTEARQLAAAAPPPTRRDGDDSRASASGSSSLNPEARPREKAISTAKLAPKASAPSSPAKVMKAQEPPAPLAAANLQNLVSMSSLPTSVAPLGRDPPASPGALEDALLALTQLRNDL